MKAACTGEVTASAAGEFSCSACPEQGTNWDAGVVRFGHFLRPGAQNALVEMIGCGPGRPSPIARQATSLLLEKRGGTWTRSGGVKPAFGEDCRVMPRRDGRELLFCRTTQMFHGEMHDWLQVVDFAMAGNTAQLIHLTDTSQVACAYEGYRSDSIDGIQVSGDRAPGIAIQVSTFIGKYTDEERDTCSQHPLDPPKAGETRKFDFVFQFDGSRFRATPATVSALKRFGG